MCMENEMATVKYTKKVIVNTADRYARPHLEYSLEAEIERGETPERAFERLRKIVDSQIADEIYQIQFGREKRDFLASERKERDRRECIANTYGLSIA